MNGGFHLPGGDDKEGLAFKSRQQAEPEINLIPFIDVLLVILIFLVLTTTYNQNLQLRINLPIAQADKEQAPNPPLHITVTANGDYGLQGKLIGEHTADALSEALLARIRGSKQPVLIISADALSSHQSVITAVDAARMAGITHITFALQTPQGAPRR
jgi:biopolymer transport protein ExbD